MRRRRPGGGRGSATTPPERKSAVGSAREADRPSTRRRPVSIRCANAGPPTASGCRPRRAGTATNGTRRAAARSRGVIPCILSVWLETVRRTDRRSPVPSFVLKLKTDFIFIKELRMRDLVIISPRRPALRPVPADVFAAGARGGAPRRPARDRHRRGHNRRRRSGEYGGPQPTRGRAHTNDEAGRFVFNTVGPSPARHGSSPSSAGHAGAGRPRSDLRLVLAPLPYTDQVTVQPRASWSRVTSAMRGHAAARRAAVRECRDPRPGRARRCRASPTWCAMPGVGIAQGEGNRDTPIFRGSSSTSDYTSTDPRRRQYFRDLYNVERIRGPEGPEAA